MSTAFLPPDPADMPTDPRIMAGIATNAAAAPAIRPVLAGRAGVQVRATPAGTTVSPVERLRPKDDPTFSWAVNGVQVKVLVLDIDAETLNGPADALASPSLFEVETGK
ncbi:MAG: hypothetical protein RIB84_07605 [Sneathiellaceae bacterium]